MGLTEKLEELDHSVWKQYEKVTHYCNTEFGWNKYDLIKKAATGISISAVGTSVYGILEGYLVSSPALAVSHLFSPAMALSISYIINRTVDSFEKNERHKLEKGIIEAPKFKAWRPLLFPVMNLNAITSIASFLGYPKISENISLLTQKNYHLLEGLRNAGMASMLFFACSASYFKDQIMTPPKKKKTIPQAIKEKITEKIETVPQLEEAKYESIDDIVV